MTRACRTHSLSLLIVQLSLLLMPIFKLQLVEWCGQNVSTEDKWVWCLFLYYKQNQLFLLWIDLCCSRLRLDLQTSNEWIHRCLSKDSACQIWRRPSGIWFLLQNDQWTSLWCAQKVPWWHWSQANCGGWKDRQKRPLHCPYCRWSSGIFRSSSHGTRDLWSHSSHCTRRRHGRGYSYCQRQGHSFSTVHFYRW